MRHIYLINSDSRAAQYGIGTYIIQVINCLSSIDSLRLTVVSMNSEDGILTEKKDNNVRYLTFPKVYDWRSEKEIQRYYNGARYYNPNNRRSNIFDDFDYKIVKETVDATEELLKEYEQIHIKNLEDLTKDL